MKSRNKPKTTEDINALMARMETDERAKQDAANARKMKRKKTGKASGSGTDGAPAAASSQERAAEGASAGSEK